MTKHIWKFKKGQKLAPKSEMVASPYYGGWAHVEHIMVLSRVGVRVTSMRPNSYKLLYTMKSGNRSSARLPQLFVEGNFDLVSQ